MVSSHPTHPSARPLALRSACLSVFPTPPGLGDSGGRWAKQVLDSNLLDEGFRVWTLDLATVSPSLSLPLPSLVSSRLNNEPSSFVLLQHGRSSGTHCHIMEESQLPKSLEAVLVAIASEDRKVNNEEGGGRRRKTFLVGHSLGGWTMYVYDRSLSFSLDSANLTLTY